MSLSSDKPLGVILAGGKATRMGGGDKALLELGSGQTLLDHVMQRLAPQVSGMAINANGDPARFAHTALPVVADTLPDFPGPLAGVLAGLDWAAEQGARHIVTVAGDTPFFPTDLVAQLQATGNDLALAATVDGRHPTFGLWPVALRADLEDALQDGLRKVVRWTDKHGAGTATFPDDAAFFNVNTPEDLAHARSLL
ncbi:molybdenum cofactor guanylyltransferase MobA [Pseudaestuariivita sp.]|uniref:molybdenum cofactor guanylyltransferase MobA n=1 Tax=Pseudaestuariivita sp. TaxID=2211669 RepID=UPI0040591BE8